MLAVLMLFALVNGLLVYSMIKKSDSDSITQFDYLLWKHENNSMMVWLEMAKTIVMPYVVLANEFPDSTNHYKNRVLKILNEIKWSSNKKNYDGHYYILNAIDGSVILNVDSLDNLPFDKLLKNAVLKDSSFAEITNIKRCKTCPVMKGIAKGIIIPDWNWLIGTFNFSDEIYEESNAFSQRYKDNREKLMGNLLGIMAISFLIGLLVIFRQVNSFVLPLHGLSDFLHDLVEKGFRFINFKPRDDSQMEISNLAEDLNSLIGEINKLMDDVRKNADEVSDLGGNCTDMLDGVIHEADMVVDRTSEMSITSKLVVNNVNGMVKGIEDVNSKLNSLKKSSLYIAEETAEIKISMSQMNEVITELNESSSDIQDNVLSVTQAVNDISSSSLEDFNRIESIDGVILNLIDSLRNIFLEISNIRKDLTLSIGVINKNENKDSDKVKVFETIKNICDRIEDFFHQISSFQIQLADLQEKLLEPLIQITKERRKLSEEIHLDSLALNETIRSVVKRIAEINSKSNSINCSIGNISNNASISFSNLEETVKATFDMNEHTKQATKKMDEFDCKTRKVEDAHIAIKSTLKEVKDYMKKLNELSADLRQFVDNLIHLENKDH